ncbi:MAG: right-handed parallel beta-helix repeat-containing protein, partial [Promethearchaeota archaeon]
MKGNRIASLLIVSILMIAAPVQLFNTVSEASSDSLRLNPISDLAYELHDFIYIDGDVDFADTALDEDWDGDGSIGNPYIIEGYNITTAEYCIRIFSTTAYFIIRDCYLRPLDEWDSGIYFNDVVNGYVYSCHIDSGDRGMSLYYCFDTIVANTLIQCSGIALDLYECQYNLFANNTFQGGGLSTWTMNEDSFLNTFYNNTVNGLPLGYFRGLSDQTIDGDLYGQVVLASCNNVTVDGGNFHDTWQGPMIFFSTGCTLENAIVQDCALGVHLMFSPETRILNNIIRNSNHIGVLSNTSDSVEIRNNEIYNNPVGIEASEFVFLIIGNNTIHGGYSGIVAFIGGLAEITENRIYDNSNYGIRLAYWASNATIYDNMLGWNGVSNGYDEETANLWDDDVSQGNYWDDYGGVGTYPIPGPGGSVDRYPQVLVDSAPPSILSPGDLVFEVGSTGNVLQWRANDYFPHLYEVLQNETLFADGQWNSSAEIIEVNVDSLPIGVYNFTITFVDRSYQNSTDSVLVTVLPDENPPIVNSPNDIAYEQGESGFNIVWNATDANPLL